MKPNNAFRELQSDNPALNLRTETDAQTASTREVIERFGLFPELYRPNPGAAGIDQQRWSFAKAAYLDNPLPPLFKERLFIHLSGFCTARYSLLRHAGFLIGLGHPGGDPTVIPQTVNELERLLDRAPPQAITLTAALLRIEAMAGITVVPDVGTLFEQDFFDSLAAVFVEPNAAARIRVAIQAAFGEPAFEHIMSLMAFIHTEHYWVETHPWITIESDMATLMENDQALASLFFRPDRLYGPQARAQLTDALSQMTRTNGQEGFGQQFNDPCHKSISEFRKIENAEAKLLHSEERFKVLINAIPQVIWGNDAQGQANYFNKRWFDFSGLTFDESAGSGWQAMVHPDDAPESVSRWRNAMQKNEQFETEYRLRGGDGIYRWFIGRNVPLLDAENHVLGWFGTATDIDKLKNAEALLLESRERLRITMESASDYVIITLDVEGNITSWSKGAEYTFGYTQAEVLGQYAALIFTPEDREEGALEKEINQAALEGRALDERWHMGKGERRFYMSGVMSPIISDTGLQGFVKVARNMTEQKLMEQMKDEFIGIASHELKTPVTSIKGYAQILEAKFALDGDSEDTVILRRLNAQVGRLTTLIGNLLDTTKISEGELALYPERFQLNELIGVRVEEIQGLTTMHRLTFHAGNIGPVIADKERIGQVLTNLLSNAVKYSPSGGEVTISTHNLGANVQVTVIDQGIGIPEAAKKKIFDRFFRVNSSQTHSLQGMGLGLYISAGIINRHNGSMFVESREGGGSIFTFHLPYAPLK